MMAEADFFLDYYELEAELKKMQAAASAAEAHGILAGQLAAGLRLEALMWLKQFLPAVGVKREPPEAQREWFYQLRDASKQALASPEFSFTLLLPEDDEPMSQRLEAVGDWASGFLAGFGSVGQPENKPLSADITQAFRDLSEISKIDIEIDDASMGDETAYIELVEYLKTVALLCFTEYGIASGDHPANPNLH